MVKRGRPRVQGLAERRREEILDVATRAFSRQGFAGTDLQDVADSLGLGKGTVYRYFPTKEDLFLAAADRGMRLLKDRTSEAAEETTDSLGKIIRATHAYLRFFDDHPEFVELFMQERAEFRDRRRPTYFVHRDANIGPWRRLMGALITDGVIRRIPVDRIMDVFNATLYGTIFTNYFDGRRRSPAAQAWEILDVVFQGILERNEDLQALKRRSGL
jgi:AcrR family transcriptional regulator